MEFDINKVYTAVNADDLKIGSLIVAGCNLKELELKVKKDSHTHPLIEVTGKDRANRFGVDDCGCLYYYPLAYLIEPPKEPKYKPFSSVEKAMEVIMKHGGWINRISNGFQYFAIARSRTAVRLSEGFFSLKELFDDFVFADDGTPCGELVEE